VELISNGKIILEGVLKIQDMSCMYRIQLGEKNSSSYSTESPTSVEVAEFLDRLSD